MRIYLHQQFRREFKTLLKKYPSLKNDVASLIAELTSNPTLGESLGKNRFKIRLKITSKGKGKSGGGRVITLVKITDEEIWLLTLYDKSNIASVSDDFLEQLSNNLDE